MAQLNNIRSVSVPGVGKLPLADKAGTFTPSGVKRDHKPGRLAEDGGYIEMAVPAKLEANLNLRGGLDVTLLQVKDVDVTVMTADGGVHLMSKAFASEPTAVGEGEGKLTLMSNISEKIS